MGPIQKRLTLALCGVALAAFTTGALATPRHHRHAGYRHQAVAAIQAVTPTDDRYANAIASAKAGGTQEAPVSAARSALAQAEPQPQSVVGGSSSMVSEARRYIGGNPTGRGSLWCGAFMDMVLKHTGHSGGGNLASAYARYGTRVSGPQVGAIAVMGRRGGGHVGVVSGVDASGNPIIISGNHNRRVAESVYPRGRISAYVLPN
ncbi:MAG: TIGR02594 family protein [Pseudolabrys sp.]